MNEPPTQPTDPTRPMRLSRLSRLSRTPRPVSGAFNRLVNRDYFQWLARFWDRGRRQKAVIIALLPVLAVCAWCGQGVAFAAIFSATPAGQQINRETSATETAQTINAQHANATQTIIALTKPTPTAQPTATPKPTPTSQAMVTPSAAPASTSTPSPTQPPTPQPTPHPTQPPVLWQTPVASSSAQAGTTWYFAEGTTGGTNREYLTIANPNTAPAQVHVRYLLLNGTPVDRAYTIEPTSRFTQSVNAEVGPSHDVAMVVTSDIGVVAERPMYFTYRLHGGGYVSSGFDVMGASQLETQALFGLLDTTAHHDTYLTVLNPQTTDMAVEVDYFPATLGPVIVRNHTVAALSRGTFNVRNDVPTGRYSAVVHLSVPGLVERPMYLLDAATGFTGADDVIGVPVPQKQWLFAEGLTNGTRTHERYVLANPCPTYSCLGATTAHVVVTFFTGPGNTPYTAQALIDPGQQQVLEVANIIGADHVENSVMVTADTPVLAERLMNFSYGSEQGATDVLGVSQAGQRFYFAEGNASGSFDTYLTLENPDATQTAKVTVAFLPGHASDNVSVRTFSVAPSSRFTFKANAAMQGSFSMVVDADHPIVAERPIYFTFGASQGGDDVLGYQSLTLPMPQPRVAPTPTTIPQPTATPAPTAIPTDTPVPAPPPSPPSPTCIPGAVNCNPWGFNFTPGSLIYNPPGDFCDYTYFSCIGNFWNGRGYVVECQDGKYSKSGGIQGACSYHRGVWRPLYSH